MQCTTNETAVCAGEPSCDARIRAADAEGTEVAPTCGDGNTAAPKRRQRRTSVGTPSCLPQSCTPPLFGRQAPSDDTTAAEILLGSDAPKDCSSPMTPRSAATKNAEIMQEFQRLQQEEQLSPKTAADKILQNKYTAEDLAGSGPGGQASDTTEAASH